MDDLQRYLNDEFRDPEYRRLELDKENRMTGWDRWHGWAMLAGLCLFMANFLYWRP